MKCKLLLLCFISLISCQFTEQEHEASKNGADIMSVDKEDGYSQRCKELNIDNLKDFKEKNQIRIWIEFSLYDSGKIIIFKREDSAWVSEFHQYRFNIEKNKTNALVSHNKITAKPLSGWNNFIKNIIDLGIYDLNDSDRKENYGLCNDGGAMRIEIVNNRNYAEYIYPCWSMIEDQAQINKIKNVLNETEKEFGFNVFPLDFEKGRSPVVLSVPSQ